MKKYFFFALCALFITDMAQAQKSVTQSAANTITKQPAKTVSGAPIAAVPARGFNVLTAEFKTSLNANDFTKAQSQWVNIHHNMARRADEFKKANDIAGADKRYELVSKLKLLSQDMQVNKAALIDLMNQMDAAY
jgi:hypothetical protein